VTALATGFSNPLWELALACTCSSRCYIVLIVAALWLAAQESQKTTALGNPFKFKLVFLRKT
jgi:hypothetical protein